MSADHSERQINVRGEIIIDGPCRLIGSFTGTIAEGRIVTSGNVTIGDDADVHASIEPDSVSIQPGTASLTYVPAPSPTPERSTHAEYRPRTEPDAAPRRERAPQPAPAQERRDEGEYEPPMVTFPQNQPQVPAARQRAEDTEDNAARQARARLAAYSRKATGTDDPSGWASS
ncbi:MAG: hypothetical protein RLN60_04990 [Phycisphaerales bacterium]